MTKTIRASMVLWILLLSNLNLPALHSEAPYVGKFISPDRSFELTVPVGYGVQTGKHKRNRSYIPVCHDGSLVCITFPLGRYKGTTFQDASLEVVREQATTANACMNPGTPALEDPPDAGFQTAEKKPRRMIDGTQFLHAFDRGAASSHDIETNRYRGYKRGRCYELALHVTFANFSVYDPGTINEFTKQDKEQVTAQLEQILDSFRFLQ